MNEPAWVARVLPPVALQGDDGIVKPTRMTRVEQLVVAGVGLLNIPLSAGIAATLDGGQGLVVALGVVTGVLTVLAARVGNRLFAALAVLACSFAHGGGGSAFAVVGIVPYYGVAMWMVLKQNRLAKEQAALRRQQRQASGAGTGGRASRGTTGPGRRGAAPVGPPPSKRYTPPKAKKKAKPKPTPVD